MEKLTQRLGRQIKLFRKSRNLLQSELAEMISVEPKYLSRLETGLSSPSLKTLEKIALVFNIEISELFNFPQQGSREYMLDILNKKIRLYDENELRMLLSFSKIIDTNFRN